MVREPNCFSQAVAVQPEEEMAGQGRFWGNCEAGLFDFLRALEGYGCDKGG